MTSTQVNKTVMAKAIDWKAGVWAGLIAGAFFMMLEMLMVPLLGKECRTDPKLYAKASPIEYVCKSTPPTLLIHGNADWIVPIIHSERFFDKLKANGVKTEFVTMKGKGHGWTGDAAEESSKAAVKFLDEHLKKPVPK